MKDKLVSVYAGSPMEVDLVRSILVADGIDVYLKDEFMGTLIAFVTPAGSGAVKLLVSEDDAERATYLIKQFEQSKEKS
jgi:hypothetical protein